MRATDEFSPETIAAAQRVVDYLRECLPHVAPEVLGAALEQAFRRVAERWFPDYRDERFSLAWQLARG
jgi:hypothetical protein